MMSLLKTKDYKLKTKRGQVMVLTVILLSGAILGVTAIVGLLMIYQTRNAVDVINSAKALSAADAGIQCALMRYKEIRASGSSERNCGTKDNPIVLTESGAKYNIEEILNEEGELVGFRSLGTSGRVSRSFEAGL